MKALVAGFEVPGTPEVADAVDAPGDVVDQKDADDATPEKSRQGTPPRLRHASSNHGRRDHPEDSPEGEPRVELNAERVGEEISHVR